MKRLNGFTCEAFQALAVSPPTACVQPAVKRKELLKNAASMLSVFRPRKRELVAGGDVLWKPVNKEASMLLSKSSYICKPITHTTMKITQMEQVITEKKVSEDEQATAIGKKLLKQAKNTPQEAIEFAEEVAKAREILYQATDGFRSDVFAFTRDEMPKCLEKVRAWRMTVERETNMSIRALEDLRKFFLSDLHEKEMLRLNEFVRTCERLAALSKDGTLDAVADIMLKLS